jgi:ribosome-associated heat shock protein Hsp15
LDGERIRIDKWLWQARFCKSRTLAATLVEGGKVRLNGSRITKPAQLVGAGDALTFPQGNAIRVVTILACGTRRGPAFEAQTLFQDHRETSVPPEASGTE